MMDCWMVAREYAMDNEVLQGLCNGKHISDNNNPYKPKENDKKNMKDNTSYRNVLRPLHSKPKEYRIASYDVETATTKNKYIQGGYIDDKGKYKSSQEKEEMIESMLENISKRAKTYATFNRFDFFVLFAHRKDWNKYGINMRGGLLMWKEYQHLNFYDTMSYTKSSVKALGKMLELPKMKYDVTKNTLHMSRWKMRKMIAYNRRDCEVTRGFMIGFQKLINELGGELKQTIGSCAMDLFRRKYLQEEIYHETIKNKKFKDEQTVRDVIYNAYHGGRTEMFKRGYDAKHIYTKGDFNSLYPSVMLNKYPKPSTAIMSERIDGELDKDTILKYEGVTECEVIVPYMYYPILPTRINDKLCFPIGKFRDYFTNVELRLALQHGVKITKIYKVIAYMQTFKPFTKWVNELYKLRMKYDKEYNIVYKEIIKLLLNNLYGKFAMRHVNKIEMLRDDERNDDDLAQEGFIFEGFGYGIKETPIKCNQTYIIPIFAVYTTAYARIKLWKALVKYDSIYCDTDSIFSRKRIIDSKKLGELKVEGKSRGLNIFKVKHYSEKDLISGKIHRKVKGLTLSSDEDEEKREKEQALQFEDSINGNNIQQRRIIGLKESLRGKYALNEVVYITKKFDAWDNKRAWIKPYSKFEMRDSKPLIVGFDDLESLEQYYNSI